MAQLDPVALAKTAYAAYGETTGGKNYRGDPMPAWGELGHTIQRAWTAAATAVFKAATNPPRSES